MNEFENWLKEQHADWSADQHQPDSNQIIAGVQQRIKKRRTRRQFRYVGISTLAAIALVLVFSWNRSAMRTPSQPDLLSQSSLFGDTLVSAVMDATEMNTLYWSSMEYLIDEVNPTQPIPEINLSEDDVHAFEAYLDLEEQNS